MTSAALQRPQSASGVSTPQASAANAPEAVLWPPGKLMRPPPSYDVYASDDLANSAYFGLSAGERGLLDSMQRAWWVERRLPRDTRLLARVVRLDVDEVERFLTPAVLAHFNPDGADAAVLHASELQRQLAKIENARREMSNGGKIGADLTNQKRGSGKNSKPNKDFRDGSGYPASYRAGSGRGPERTERTERTDQKLSLGNAKKGVVLSPEDRAFVQAYEQHQPASPTSGPARATANGGHR